MPIAALLLILAAVAMVAAVAIAAGTSGLVYWGRTAAGRTSVHADDHVMGERIRVLEVEGTYQSATFLDERWADPVFPYHLAFDHVFDPWPDGTGPASVAVLGGGGYAIPKHFVAHHPEVQRIDVVEIDPAIERIARRHFFLDRLERTYHAEAEGRLALHVGDAYAWLCGSRRRYDAIINDCFCALEPDERLLSLEGLLCVREHLAEGGLYLTNVVSAVAGADAEVLRRLLQLLLGTFAHVWVYVGSPDDPQSKDNNIVIACDRPHRFEGAWEVEREGVRH